MNKQKQIEELKKILCTPCAELVEEHDKTKNLPAIYAETLYNAGYRKADEVRKETAKEFAEKLKKRLNLLYEWQYAKVDLKTIDELLKEYEK